jgi:hypothetical protein
MGKEEWSVSVKNHSAHSHLATRPVSTFPDRTRALPQRPALPDLAKAYHAHSAPAFRIESCREAKQGQTDRTDTDGRLVTQPRPLSALTHQAKCGLSPAAWVL